MGKTLVRSPSSISIDSVPSFSLSNSALKQSALFQQADDGRRAVYLTKSDGAFVATNEAWGKLYLRPLEILRDMWERRCIQAFLFAS